MSRRVLLWGCAAALAGGCYSTNRVRPEQLERASGAYIDTYSVPMMQYSPMTGQMSLGSATAIRSQSAITFDRPEGGTVTVKGALDVDITTVAGRRYRFEHPVTVRLEQDVLDLRSASRSGRVRLADVGTAEVRNMDLGKSILAGTALGLGVGLLTLGLLLSI